MEQNRTKPKFDPKEGDKMTRDELRNLLKAMGKEGFDEIMEEYMKEISDPNNVKETNEYLRNAEQTKDLPSNVKLAQPGKGFCLKSEKYSIKRPAARQKVYVNICSYDGVGKPFENPPSSNMWSLPHLINKGRNDQTNKGKLCTTYDVIFHSEAIKKANSSLAFKKFVCDSAVNGINNNLLKASEEKISNDYTIKSKYEYKGKEVAYMNVHALHQGEFDSKKEPIENYQTNMMKEVDQIKNASTQNIEDQEESTFDKPDINVETANKEVKELASVTQKEEDKKPKYKIKYSDIIELHKYFYNPSKENEDQYQKLIIEISVPKLASLNQANLELDTKKLKFSYKDIYNLDLELPVEIDKDKSEAKFDRKKETLTISANIVRKNIQQYNIKEDENIEIVRDEEDVNTVSSMSNTEKDEKNLTNHEIKKSPIKENIKEKDDMPFITSPKKQKLNEEKEGKNDEKDEKDGVSSLKEEKKELLEVKERSENDIVIPDKTSTSSNTIQNLQENKSLQNNKVIEINSNELKKDMDHLQNKQDEDDVISFPSINGKIQKKEMLKISYITFNCNLIYEID
jgi:dynein assembly factor 2